MAPVNLGWSLPASVLPVHCPALAGRRSALCGNLNLPMHRAARSATADHVRALLQQLLFVHRAKLLATRLQYQLEETMDDLDDIGFDEQVLSGVLRTTHLELCGFIARCDQAMLTTEQRILRILVR